MLIYIFLNFRSILYSELIFKFSKFWNQNPTFIFRFKKKKKKKMEPTGKFPLDDNYNTTKPWVLLPTTSC